MAESRRVSAAWAGRGCPHDRTATQGSVLLEGEQAFGGTGGGSYPAILLAGTQVPPARLDVELDALVGVCRAALQAVHRTGREAHVPADDLAILRSKRSQAMGRHSASEPMKRKAAHRVELEVGGGRRCRWADGAGRAFLAPL